MSVELLDVIAQLRLKHPKVSLAALIGKALYYSFPLTYDSECSIAALGGISDETLLKALTEFSKDNPLFVAEE